MTIVLLTVQPSLIKVMSTAIVGFSDWRLQNCKVWQGCSEHGRYEMRFIQMQTKCKAYETAVVQTKIGFVYRVARKKKLSVP